MDNYIEEYKKRYFEYLDTDDKYVSPEFAEFLNHTFGTQKIDGKIIHWIFYEGMSKETVSDFIKNHFTEIYEENI
jgi:hypothetical protein